MRTATNKNDGSSDAKPRLTLYQVARLGPLAMALFFAFSYGSYLMGLMPGETLIDLVMTGSYIGVGMVMGYVLIAVIVSRSGRRSSV